MTEEGRRIQSTVQWMPCIGEAGLVLFGATADQRASLGEQVFKRTHTPIDMRTQTADRLVGRMTEGELLAQLTNSQSLPPGNRVFVLYGAAGAGKSELLRWLEMEIAQREPKRAEVLIRVSRTELDVMRIVERFQSQIGGRFFSAQTHARWDDLRTKPLTMAKLLVLTALERLLTRDEEINALFYWLTAPVQRNLERGFEALEDNHADAGVMELFSEEDWLELSRSSELGQLVEPESLRAELVAAFSNLLLEDVHLPETLQRLNRPLPARNNMPAAPPTAKVSQSSHKGERTGLRFAIKGPREGQIADLCAAAGLEIVSMKRIRIGRVGLTGLGVGEWRCMSDAERV